MKKMLFLVVFLPFLANAQVINTVAGNGMIGFGGDGGPATDAVLSIPSRVTFDNHGNLYIADGFGNRIRKVTTDGIINSIAGNGTPGFSGDGGPATDAMINGPDGIAVDTVGNVFISEPGNNRVRKISIAGIITTYAGNGILSAGPNGDGGPATAAIVSNATANVLDNEGNLYVADGNSRVRKVSPSGIITTVIGNGAYGFSGDGGPATSAMISTVTGIAIDGEGNIYITDGGNARVRKISRDGIITTVAGTGYTGYTGDGGPATNATFKYELMGIVADKFGNLIISDYGNNVIRKVSASGIITTIAGNGIQGYAGDGGPATEAEMYDNRGLAIDNCDNVYICDEQNQRVRKVSFSTCDYLNLPEIKKSPVLSIYPNPATSILSISFLEIINVITIYNTVGQTLCNREYGAKTAEIDIARWPAGIYFVKINGAEVRQFVKQ